MKTKGAFKSKIDTVYCSECSLYYSMVFVSPKEPFSNSVTSFFPKCYILHQELDQMEEPLKGEGIEILDDPQELPEYIVQQGAEMLAQKSGPEVVESMFVDYGLSAEDARTFTEQLREEIREEKKDNGNKNMLYGAVFCVGGIIGTLADIGFVFWGAILFGGIQFSQGLLQSMASKKI